MSHALIDIPDDHVAAVVTYLAMDRRPPVRDHPPSVLKLAHPTKVEPERYRRLFRRVGSHWLWFSRLQMDEDSLTRSIGELHVVLDGQNDDAGMIELDFPVPGECLIRFLGLVPELAGQGHGQWLFSQLMELAWRPGISRLRVHTCSLDHPAALKSYLRAGFTARRRAFEHFPDPRLAGLLPRDAAPQIPIIEPD